jgi:hypothetical protein
MVIEMQEKKKVIEMQEKKKVIEMQEIAINKQPQREVTANRSITAIDCADEPP